MSVLERIFSKLFLRRLNILSKYFVKFKRHWCYYFIFLKSLNLKDIKIFPRLTIEQLLAKNTANVNLQSVSLFRSTCLEVNLLRKGFCFLYVYIFGNYINVPSYMGNNKVEFWFKTKLILVEISKSFCELEYYIFNYLILLW